MERVDTEGLEKAFVFLAASLWSVIGISNVVGIFIKLSGN